MKAYLPLFWMHIIWADGPNHSDQLDHLGHLNHTPRLLRPPWPPFPTIFKKSCHLPFQKPHSLLSLVLMYIDAWFVFSLSLLLKERANKEAALWHGDSWFWQQTNNFPLLLSIVSKCSFFNTWCNFVANGNLAYRILQNRRPVQSEAFCKIVI